MSHWTLFSNHGHVLLYVSHEPEARLRDIADRVGITERAVQKIVRDLQDGGLVNVIKHGRCNRYEVHGNSKLRHDLEAHCAVSELVSLIHPESAPGMIDMTAQVASLPASDSEEHQPDTAAHLIREEAPVKVSDPGPIVDPEPESDHEPIPEQTPEPTPEPEPIAAAKPAPVKPTKPKRKRDKGEGPDRGEQGSLF